MYEKSGMTKKAASLYITANNLSKAEPLVQIVSDVETYKAFAKAKEQVKQFDEALEAYKLSGARLSNHLSCAQNNFHFKTQTCLELLQIIFMS